MGVWTPGPGPTTGNDTFVGDNTNEVASGGEGNDTLSGNGGSDTLNGGDNDDVLAGGLANDIINGDAGNDTINWAWGDGIDTIDGGADADTFNATGSVADNVLRATWNGSVLTHVLDGAISNVESINADMAGGTDWLVYTATAGVTVNLQAGTASGFNSVANVENVIGGDGHDTISGNGANNRLEGGLGDDTLNGAAGADNLIGGDGADTLSGGLAGDSLNGGVGNDTLIWNWGEGADTLNGGADSDTLNATGSASDNIVRATWNGSTLTNLFDNVLVGLEAVNVDMSGGTDWLVYIATAGVTVDLGAGTASGFASVTSVENVIGGSGGDAITGSAGDNRLDGAEGADTLNGGAGIDIVIGGSGADTLAGGLGNDNVIGDAGNDTLSWNWGDGRDTLNGGADTDTLNATGSAAENIVQAAWNGSAVTNLFDNVLIGVEAINLDMGGGTDWLVYNTSSNLTVDLGAGTGTGFATITSVENVVAGSGADTITGSAVANRLEGGLGNDALNGAGGIDNLIGGEGADTLAGGTSNDTITAGAGNDTVNWAWGDGADAINGGADTDTLNIVGSAAENVLNATYNGATLTSVVAGTLVSVEAVNADMGGGTDWLVYTTTSAVNVDLGLGTATGFASIASVENVVGASGNDTLTGDANANRLVGGAGSDTLTANGGADVLLGGADADTVHGGGGADIVSGEGGDDILIVDSALDTVAGETYDGGDGADTLRVQQMNTEDADFRGSTLASIEALAIDSHQTTVFFDAEDVGAGLSSTLSVDGFGFVNNVTFQRSTAGATDLSGFTFQNFNGTVSLEGSGGDDTLTGTSQNDVILGAAGADVLSGGDGVDELDGGAGDDDMDGGAGDDTYVVDSAADSITDASGTDLVLASASYTLGVGLENLTLTGVGAIDGVGNASANIMMGNESANTLTANDGADTLHGAGGADTVHGGGGLDTVYGEGGDDILLVGGTLDSESGETYDGGDGFDTLRAQGAPGHTAEFRASTLASIESVALQNMTAYFAGEDVGAGLASALVVDGLSVNNHLYFQRTTAGATDLSAFTFQNWTGASQITLEGSGGNDTLTGSSQSDTIVGGAGADTLNGGDATDYLTGGAGLDSVNGGGGADHIYITAASDLVVGETYDGGAHNDDHIWLQAAGSYSFVGVNVANVELLVLNAAGIDVTLSAESLGAGFASALRVDMTNQASVINVVRSTAGTTSLAAWTFFNPNVGTTINLTGSTGDDTLTGSSRQDTVRGGDGADTLNSGAGNDTLEGGDGNDTYVVDHSATLVEAAGEGTDTVLTSINLTLASEIENATVVGAAGLAITGNASDNVITGGDGSDVLDGAGGADTLIGGAETDYLTGGAGLDNISAGDGADHIYISAPTDLAAGETYDGGAHNDDHIWLQSAGSYSFNGLTISNVELLVMNAAGITLTFDADLLGAGLASALRVDATGQSPIINVVRSGAGTTDLSSWVFFNPGGVQVNLVGSTGSDILTGTSRGDLIIGGFGVDELYGGDGDDSLRMNDSTPLNTGEVYDGGAGTDTLVASLDINDVRNATVTSIERAAFVGVAATQVIYMDASDIGAGFSATLQVDGGNVTEAVIYTYRSSAGTTDASGWTFANWSAASYVGFSGSGGDDVLIGSSVNDVMVAEGGADTLTGGAGNDQLYGRSGNDTLEGGAGDDLIDGEGDADTASYANASAGVTVDLGNGGAQNTVGAGTDTISNVENLTGSGHGDTLTGNGSANVLTGGAGADTLTGAGGLDTVSGGSGNDTLQVLTNGHAPAGETYDGGADTDTLRLGDGNDFRGSTFTSIEAITFTGVANTSWFDAEDFGGAGFSDSLAVTSLGGSQIIELYRSGAGTTNVTAWTFSGTVQVWLRGSTGADTFYGTTQGDMILGGAGNDHLDGFSGDDTIEGGEGDDYIDASTGTDTVTYANAVAGVTVDLSSNAVQNTVGAGSDQIFNAENLTGSAHNDTLTGSASANTLTGGAGADTVTGGAGVDSVSGDAGNDTLRVLTNGHGLSGETYNGGADSDTLLLGEGNDFRGASFLSIEQLQFDGTANTSLFDAEDFGGSGFSDSLSVVSLGGSQNLELHRSGAGTTNVTAWTFSGTVQVYLYGSTAADTFYGTTQGDIISGGDGNDHLDGFSGNDTIEGGLGDDYIDASTGTDVVTYATAASGVTVSLATNAVQNTVGAGSDQIFNAENLTGSGFADTLTGSTSANTISGGAGNDTIEGGAGDDTLDGGANTDTASYASAGSGVTVDLSNAGAQNTVGAGTDTLSSFENLAGSAFGDTLTGDGNANVITAGSGADTVDGGGGNDTLSGDAGNDTLTGGLGDDTIDGGADTDTASYAAALAGVTVNLSTLTAQNTVGAGTDTISNVENVTGSAFADVLTGDGNANVLSGGAGNDTLDGGAGNDTLDGGADSDAANYISATSGVTVSLAIAGAQNTVGAGTDTLSNIENISGSGFNDTLTGNDSANVLSGGAGNDNLSGAGGDDNFSGSAGTDTINGGDGEDVINAGADNDTLTGGADTDVFVYGAGAGTDTITDFDADATGGQDFIDVTQFGITAGDFNARVSITDLGSDTRVIIDGSVTIFLTGVDGTGNNVITIDDFGLV